MATAWAAARLRALPEPATQQQAVDFPVERALAIGQVDQLVDERYRFVTTAGMKQRQRDMRQGEHQRRRMADLARTGHGALPIDERRFEIAQCP